MSIKTSSAKAKDYKRPLNKYRQAKNPLEYLMQRVEIGTDSEDPCWIFTGGKDRNGYGQVHSAKSAKELGVTRAHQMSYKVFKGDIPKGYFVCHKCDNPPCINPEHLFVGTALDNNKDMWEKGRWKNGVKPKYDHDYIVSQHGIKDCFQVAEELGCSWGLVCHVWRNNGLSGRLWSYGNKRSI